MNRRHFLDLRQLAQNAGHVVAALGDVDDHASLKQEAELTLVRYARPAMATVFEIVLPFGHVVPTSTIHAAFDLIDELEAQLTVYRPSSEVCDLNRRGSDEAVRVSPVLFDLLKLSKQLSHAIGGAFDATAGAVIDAWGYVRGPRRVPTLEERQQALAASGYQRLRLFEEEQSVRFDVPGMQINFGSIGKGYALDRVAEFFAESCPVQPMLLHGGKSSVLAIGTPPGHSEGWSVAIEHPWNPHEKLATITLMNQACATSAATYKHLVHEGRKLGHILDPRTGWPTEGIASATAIADSAAEADALSTAFYVMGRDRVEEFCQVHTAICALLLAEGAKEIELIEKAKA